MSSQKAPAGHFTILYFAAASSFTKKQYEHLPAPLKVSALSEELEKRYPGIKNKVLDSSALTVNLDYVDLEEAKNATIEEGDEVAIIPPVSSG
ncbi:Molybdopterin synthase sulfur carrier subunit [Delphinella strobiligena]|nr:Molybdopterin synthase sulfur carrier subunit [Delphinella strobiligena]